MCPCHPRAPSSRCRGRPSRGPAGPRAASAAGTRTVSTRAERRAVGRGHGLERQGHRPAAGARPRGAPPAAGGGRGAAPDRARDRRLRPARGPTRSRGERHGRGGARPQPIRRSRSVAAMGLARRPTSFTGPTHDGQPGRQAHACRRLRARASSSGRILEEPLGQADAARLAVVEIDGGLEAARRRGGGRLRSGRPAWPPAPASARAGRRRRARSRGRARRTAGRCGARWWRR